MIPVTCPSCGQRHDLPASALNKTLRCTGCSTPFTARRAAPAAPPPPGAAGPTKVEPARKPPPAAPPPPPPRDRGVTQSTPPSDETSPNPPPAPPRRMDESGAIQPLYEKIGAYQVREVLGQGGFGQVCRAVHPADGREVAIKILHHARDDARRRFEKEIEALKKITYPNIPTVIESGIHNDQPYLVTVLVKGEDLKKQMERRAGPWPPREAVEMVLKLVETLDYVHRHAELLHRDVKPSNIRIGVGNAFYLMDFGLTGDRGKADITQPGAAMGTPLYMAPEQVKGERERQGSWTDMYASGVILYELLTGRHPVDALDLLGVYFQILSKDVRPPSEVVPGLDRRLDEVCLKALAKEPKQRYASGEEFARALRSWLESGSQPGIPAAPVRPAAASSPAPRPKSEIFDAVTPTRQRAVLPPPPPSAAPAAAWPAVSPGVVPQPAGGPADRSARIRQRIGWAVMAAVVGTVVGFVTVVVVAAIWGR